MSLSILLILFVAKNSVESKGRKAKTPDSKIEILFQDSCKQSGPLRPMKDWVSITEM